MLPRSVSAVKSDEYGPKSYNNLAPGEKCKKVWSLVSSMDAPHFDLQFICDDRVEVWCHQSVVATASSGIAELLKWQGVMTCDGEWKSGEVTIILPGVHSKDLLRVLCILYNGYAKVNVKAAEELKKVWKQLGIDIVRLNNKDKIEVVNLENMVGMEKSKHFVEKSGTTVARPEKRISCNTRERVKVEHKHGATLEETVARTPVRVKRDPSLDGSVYFTPAVQEDPLSDPDDPPPKLAVNNVEQVKPTRGRKRKYNTCSSGLPVKTSSIPIPTKTFTSLPKKTKIECGSGSYYIEEIHTCLLCNGKTPDGRVDKEASNLSFREIKRLREHYSKHLYNEGKLFKHVLGEAANVDADGKIIDEFGSKFKYNCNVKNCWKSKKPACGFKEIALHNASEHDVLERILVDDERPALKRLLKQIEEAKEKELVNTQPRKCLIANCPDADEPHTSHGNYQSLKGHYSTHHWKQWFMAVPNENQPRTQRVKEPRRGTVCDICQAKVFGDENCMIEHYAGTHNRLLNAIMDFKNSEVDLENSKAVINQVFPAHANEFDKLVNEED